MDKTIILNFLTLKSNLNIKYQNENNHQRWKSLEPYSLALCDWASVVSYHSLGRCFHCGERVFYFGSSCEQRKLHTLIATYCEKQLGPFVGECGRTWWSTLKMRISHQFSKPPICVCQQNESINYNKRVPLYQQTCQDLMPRSFAWGHFVWHITVRTYMLEVILHGGKTFYNSDNNSTVKIARWRWAETMWRWIWTKPRPRITN